jgi:catechol 2,3-dioxygenase-like lactoylglutathione lyase family enzyme
MTSIEPQHGGVLLDGKSIRHKPHLCGEQTKPFLSAKAHAFQEKSESEALAMTRGSSHIELSALDLDRTREFYEGTLGFKLVVAETITIDEGGRLRHMFFDIGRDQLIGFIEPEGPSDIPTDHDPSTSRGLRVPAAFYHFAFEAGSAAALAEKRHELRWNGVAVTNIVDHGVAQSIRFKDLSGLSLEYSCMVRCLTEDDATMQDSFNPRRHAGTQQHNKRQSARGAIALACSRSNADALAIRAKHVAPRGGGMVRSRPTLRRWCRR